MVLFVRSPEVRGGTFWLSIHPSVSQQKLQLHDYIWYFESQESGEYHLSRDKSRTIRYVYHIGSVWFLKRNRCQSDRTERIRRLVYHRTQHCSE